MTTTFSGFVLITKANLVQLPKLLKEQGSGLLVAHANVFPAGPLCVDLFINPRVDVRKLAIYSGSRCGDLVNRHYRLVGKERRTDPLHKLFEALEIGKCTFLISYQASIMQGFSLDNPILYVESQKYVPAALVFMLANLPCVHASGMSDDEYKRIEAYVEGDLNTKQALKKNIEGGQKADQLLFDS